VLLTRTLRNVVRLACQNMKAVLVMCCAPMRVISVLSDAHRLNHLASFGHIESFFISSHGVTLRYAINRRYWASPGLYHAASFDIDLGRPSQTYVRMGN